MSTDLIRNLGTSSQKEVSDLPDTRTWNLLSVLYLLGVCLPFVLPAFPVGTDAYKHLMVARILADYRDPILRYSEYFTIHWRPVPTILGDLALAAFVKTLGPIAALKAYFIAFGAGLWFAGRYYFKSLGQPKFAVILLLPLAQCFYVFSAFLPFIASFALYPLLLAILVDARPRPRRSVWIALILIVLYGFHPIGAGVGCFTVGIYAVDFSRRRLDWGRLCSILPTATLIGYFFFTFAERHGGGGTLFQGPLGQVKAYIGYNVWSLSAVAAWLFVALILALAFMATRLAFAGQINQSRLIFISLSLIIIGLVMPYQISGEFVVGSRTFPFAFIAGVGSLNWSRKLLRASMVLVCVFLGISTALNTTKALAVQPSYQVFLSGISVVKPGSKLLPVIDDVTFGGNKYIQPFNSVEDLYNIYRGGANPYIFALPLVKTGGNLLEAKFAAGNKIGKYAPFEQRDYRDAAKLYDYIICWGDLPQIRPMIKSEFQLVFSNGPLSIYGHSPLP